MDKCTILLGEACIKDFKGPKFKPGDRCRVICNSLAPQCIGQEVRITKILHVSDNRVYYGTVEDDNLEGIAAESCLELIQ